MSFLKQLAKGFFRSLVNQVGRDGGRVVSRKLYRGAHATQIEVINNFKETPVPKVFDLNEIEFDIQPEIEGGSAIQFIGGFIACILPFGILVVAFLGFRNLFRKRSPVYVRVYSKLGEFAIIKSNVQRQLNSVELSKTRWRGIVYFLSILMFFLLGFLVLDYKAVP